ncbi:MAG: hypothetical protein C4322_06185 [Mastigocladus sp. ERB_26_1]
MLALHKMGMKNKPPFGFATLPTLTLSPTLREAASRLRVRGFAYPYLKPSKARLRDGNRQDCDPLTTSCLRDGDLKSGKWTHQDAKNAKK